MQSGTLIFPVIERLIYGEPAAQAVAAEAERRGAQRVFILSSGTLNRKTDEVARMRSALGARCAGVFDRMPSFTPREKQRRWVLATLSDQSSWLSKMTRAGSPARFSDITDVRVLARQIRGAYP